MHNNTTRIQGHMFFLSGSVAVCVCVCVCVGGGMGLDRYMRGMSNGGYNIICMANLEYEIIPS